MTKEEILHLANLSRIKMNDDEVVKFQGEIGAILDYVGQVNEIVSGAEQEKEKEVGLVHNVMRADEVVGESGFIAEDLIAAFPARSGNLLRVQKILNPDN